MNPANCTGTEVRIASDQFERLITALTADSGKLSVIVENQNDETVARSRGDAENRGRIETLAYGLYDLTAEVATIKKALTNFITALDAEDDGDDQ